MNECASKIFLGENRVEPLVILKATEIFKIMIENSETEKKLAAGVVRWMESGDPTIQADYLLPLVGNDLILLNQILDDWYSRGFIVWNKIAENMNTGIGSVRFGRFPLSDILWPAPLEIKNNEEMFKVDLYNDGRFVGIYPLRQKKIIESCMPNATFIKNE